MGVGGSPGPHLEGGVQARGCACIPACNETDTPQQTVTVAGCIHPTGMHSCYVIFVVSGICNIC